MPIVFKEDLHPRDGLGRFRETLTFDVSGGDFSPPDASEVDAMSEEFAAGISEDERAALVNYTADASIINSLMRGNLYEEDYYPDEIDKAERDARLASDALDKSSIPRDMAIYRAFHDKELNQVARDGNLIGAELTDGGFMSCTSDPSWLEDSQAYAAVTPGSTENGVNLDDLPDRPRDSYLKTRNAMVLRVPKGARGASVSTTSVWPDQGEVLLPPGTTVKVTGAKYLPDYPNNPKEGGTIVISADVVKQLG